MTGEGPETAVLSLEECVERLERTVVGRLAIVIGDGAPIIRPVNYVFDPHARAIVFRTGRGSKLFGLIATSRAAFEIDGIDEGERTGWSVIVSGPTEELTSASAIEHVERLGVDSWVAGDDDHWIQIHAWSISGRRITSAGERAQSSPD